MKISADTLDKGSAYKLLTGVVVPRPIAWVSTISSRGIANLAPFSCFTFVSADPPIVGFNSGLRDQKRKDTARNIMEAGEFVVNIATFDMLSFVHASAADYAEEDSEIAHLRLATLPSDIVRPPRLADSPISLECVLDRTVCFGRSGSEFITGEVKLFHIRDDLIANGKIDTEAVRPLMRLAGSVYAAIGEIVRLDKARQPIDRRSLAE